MTSYKITAPNPEYSGTVGEMQFSKGAYEGDVGEAALAYFAGAGYTVEEVTPKTAAELEVEAATAAETEAAAQAAATQAAADQAAADQAAADQAAAEAASQTGATQ